MFEDLQKALTDALGGALTQKIGANAKTKKIATYVAIGSAFVLLFSIVFLSRARNERAENIQEGEGEGSE